MSRSVLASVCAGLVIWLCAWSAFTQNPPPPTPVNVQLLKDGLFVITGPGGNVAAYVTGEGVVLVDDMYERNADDILAKLRTVTDKPVKYVLNTHQHEDHAGGNTKMPPAAEIIAHRNVRGNLVRLKQPWLPRMTFSQEAQVFLGGKEVRASYYGRGHTSGDAVIYFPDARTIHTGDLFLSGPVIPRGPGGANIFVDYAEGGSFVEWTDALDRMLKLDFDTVIPGHGPVATRADLVKFKADFEGMRNRVRDLLRQNKGKAEVSDALVNEYGWPAGGLAIAQVDAMIAELRR
jgi:glyoxylase-like metal-dependent hydrolase (beta-lactamase superfamily II)